MQNATLEQMKNMDIRKVDINDLVDIRSLKINQNQSEEERMKDYIEQIKNPYCFKVGKIAVKVSFSENGDTLADRLESLMQKM